MVVFGDLSGRVHIYIQKLNPNTNQMEFMREDPFKFQHGVRSVAFHPSDENVVMVGLMSGWIFYINPITDVVADIGQMPGRVNAMKFIQTKIKRDEDPQNVLAAASTSGDLSLYVQDDENPTKFTEILDVHAHPRSKGPQDINFGSLNKYAEVWS